MQNDAMRPCMHHFVRAVLRLIGLLSDDTLRFLARLLFSKTTRELKAATQHVRAAQTAVLRAIVNENASTVFGRAHGFASISTPDAFRAAVPITMWDALEPFVDRMIGGEKGVLVAEDPIFYATTSGTTGRRKLIPVTSSFVASCRTVARVLFRTTLTEMPGTLRGRRLSMRSPDVETLPNKSLAGSITVALSGGLDGGEGALDAVPHDVFTVKDFDTKYYLCLRFAAEQHVTTVSAVNPSTLLLFARTLAERGDSLARALDAGVLAPSDVTLVLDEHVRARLERQARRNPAAAERIKRSMAEHGRARMCDLFPHLVGLVCWKGGSAPYYLSRLVESYGDLPILDYGYAASEALMGAPLSTTGAESLLLPHAHFIELVPEDEIDAVRRGDGSTLLLDEVEIGGNYYVIVTTHGGLYRYDMGDVVVVTGKMGGAPLVVFRHKGSAMSSLTGEKLSESHVVQAMERVRPATPLHGFVVAPLLDDDGEPGYVLAVDGALTDAALAELAVAFDGALSSCNLEYEAKRTSKRLVPVVAVRLPDDAIARHRQARVAAGAPDAHVKVPYLSRDGALLLALGFEQTAPELAARLPCRRGVT
jgi:hypothetical protein